MNRPKGGKTLFFLFGVIIWEQREVHTRRKMKFSGSRIQGAKGGFVPEKKWGSQQE